MANPPLPASVYAALADPAVREVVLPPGRFGVTPQTGLVVKRPGVRVIGKDCVLVPTRSLQGGQHYPVQVVSPWLYPSVEWHFIGTVTPATDTLALGDPVVSPSPTLTDLFAGDVVLVRLGVQTYDPAEPESQVYATVKSFDGATVVFTMPLGRAIPVYPSYDDLKARTAYPDRVGPYGGSVYRHARGLGTDHGLVGFAAHCPTADVSVEGLTVEWLADGSTDELTFQEIYASKSCQAGFCRRIAFRDLTVRNPRGSCVHLTASEDSGVDGLTVEGDGRSNDYGGNSTTVGTVPLLSVWGGTGCYARDLHAVGRNLILVNTESGPVATRVENAFIKTAMDPPNVFGNTQFNVAGVAPGFSFSGIRLDAPAPLGMESSSSPRLVIRDVAFDSGEVPGWLNLRIQGYEGMIRIGKRVFGPPRTVSLDVVADKDGFTFQPPAGLYRSGKVILETRTGVRAVTVPEDIFTANPGKLILPCPDNRYGPIKPGTFENYFAAIKITVWMTPGAAPVKVRFEGEGFLG